MNEENIIILIRDLAKGLGITASDVIAYYAKWYIVSSIGWMIFGVIICFLTKFFSKKMLVFDEYLEVEALIVLIAGLMLGAFTFFIQIGDLLAPQGIAIHQIIKDITGN